MHTLCHVDWLRIRNSINDPWSISPGDLDVLSQLLIGPSENTWIRQPEEPATIASKKRGCLGSKIKEELEYLSLQAKEVFSRASETSAVEAAAFFHLRFEDHLHPLRDGNGRVGRSILCMQCSESYTISTGEMIAALEANESDYRLLFRPRNPATQFELLCELLIRLMGIFAVKLPATLPFPLDSLFPDPTPLRDFRLKA